MSLNLVQGLGFILWIRDTALSFVSGGLGNSQKSAC